MTIAQNVDTRCVRRVPKRNDARAERALATVQLSGFGAEAESALGWTAPAGRLARALVNRPRVLLLDEPLGALDLKLRENMQVELKQIQREVGITFVFVTHDQGEALTMSNRVAVFNRGRIEQVGSPTEIYEEPASRFVAGFVGTSNVLEGAAARELVGVDGPIAVRPEKVRILATDSAPDSDEVVIGGMVRDVQYHGGGTTLRVVLDAGPEFVVESQNLETTSAADAARGHKVELAFRRGHTFRLPEHAVQGEGLT
jgi:putative spermidine/putrescine transport system ATP-binding protein